MRAIPKTSFLCARTSTRAGGIEGTRRRQENVRRETGLRSSGSWRQSSSWRVSISETPARCPSSLADFMRPQGPWDRKIGKDLGIPGDGGKMFHVEQGCAPRRAGGGRFRDGDSGSLPFPARGLREGAGSAGSEEREGPRDAGRRSTWNIPEDPTSSWRFRGPA